MEEQLREMNVLLHSLVVRVGAIEEAILNFEGIEKDQTVIRFKPVKPTPTVKV